MIGCLPRVLEVLRVVVDMEASRILWVKCAISVLCKTIRIDVSTVMDSWEVLLKLCPEILQSRCMCVWKRTICVKVVT